MRQLVGTDAVDRRQRAAEDVVDAGELAAALDGEHIEGLLDNAQHGLVAARVRAHRAEIALGDEVAAAARPHPVMQVAKRRGQSSGGLRRRAHAVEGQPLGRLGTDAGQPAELRGQPLDRRGDHSHRVRAVPAAVPGRM